MRIEHLQLNHMTEPLGFEYKTFQFSYLVEGANGFRQIAARLEVAFDSAFNEKIFDSGKDFEITRNTIDVQLTLQPRTKYFWRITVWSDADEEAEGSSWFETGKMTEPWQAEWISPADHNQSVSLVKDYHGTKEIISGRAYICGLGLYELYLNNEKVGNEFLTPYFNDYHYWLQYQTYDITALCQSNQLSFEVLMGDGWYKSPFGFHGGTPDLFGNELSLIMEVCLEFSDGTTETIVTDESWQTKASPICKSGIYYGEKLDDMIHSGERFPVKSSQQTLAPLIERKSLPVIVKEELEPVQIVTSPKGELIIDMGQNMVGWLAFKNVLPKGVTIILEHGEILQNNNFYRENLRAAEAKFTYTSDGKTKWVRPHFTFFGFRYVRISGWPEGVLLDKQLFSGKVLYSDLERTGTFQTSFTKLNRLYENALWSQKGNFLDIPTDCPQRDERLGWTGDAQVFSTTAMYNMNVYPFFMKYGFDLWQEQQRQDGKVPSTVPDIHSPGMPKMTPSSAWGDAATIIPWNLFQFYGDDAILKQQYDSMVAWVDYISSRSTDFLWKKDFQFGDWLALDGEVPGMPTGGTDEDFVANAYYYYSTVIVSKTAKILGKIEDYQHYSELAKKIKTAFQAEYLSQNGKLTIDKQTAYVLALHMGLVPLHLEERVAEDLVTRLTKDNYHLKTGFVGTPYINQVLTKHGYDDLAYTLLLNEDHPSWLYAVNQGATTIWERWDSVLSDGTMNPEGMNSLNHYSYGSIVEWMYKYMLGISINYSSESPVSFQPHPNWRVKKVSGSVITVGGRYELEWEIKSNGVLRIEGFVPFNGTADLYLPFFNSEQKLKFGNCKVTKKKGHPVIRLTSGSFCVVYEPNENLNQTFTIEHSLGELLDTPSTAMILKKELPQLFQVKPFKRDQKRNLKLKELKDDSTFPTTKEVLKKIQMQFDQLSH